MDIEQKRTVVLESLRNAQKLEDKSNIVINILECIRDGYGRFDIQTNNGSMEVAHLNEFENNMIQEMNYYIEGLKKYNN